MNFTAEEYRIAAKVMNGIFGGPAVGTLEELAAQAEAGEEHTRVLGDWLLNHYDPTQLYAWNGAKLVTKLSELGWTPPEGLF